MLPFGAWGDHVTGATRQLPRFGRRPRRRPRVGSAKLARSMMLSASNRDDAPPVSPVARRRQLGGPASSLCPTGPVGIASCCGKRVRICADHSAVAISRCSCDRLGVAHSALSPTLRGANCFRFSLASEGMAVKPASFEYQAPGTLHEAVDLLASNPEAVVIAGGQSLMPVLAFRLAAPSLLVDLRRARARQYRRRR
jgi:hypothetical protein